MRPDSPPDPNARLAEERREERREEPQADRTAGGTAPRGTSLRDAQPQGHVRVGVEAANAPRPFVPAGGNVARPGEARAETPFDRKKLGIPGTRGHNDANKSVKVNPNLLQAGKPEGGVGVRTQGAPKADPANQMPDLAELLRDMIEKKASDLHLTPGVPPQVRVDGELQALPYAKLDPRMTQKLLYSVMTDDQRATLEGNLEVDFSFGLKDLARFRANVFYQRGAIAGALRLIPWRIPNFEELGLPRVIADLCDRPRGLILVTGPTGSGKSTTLAAMIDLINENKAQHIITIEDPIEYLHRHKKSIVNQRELHADTKSFNAALRSAMREDPDSVLIGEMRDLESTELALKLAETGHLTFGTLHTNGAVQTINRIIDIFPSGQQAQIRTQLSFVLQAVVSQSLLPHASGTGRVLVQEILIPNAAIRNLIREDKVHQVYSSMQSGQAEHGMKTFNQDLARLVTEKKIRVEAALNASPDQAELSTMLDRLDIALKGKTRLDREIAERAGGGGARRKFGRR